MAPELRPCTKEDLPGVLEFFRDVWGPEHVFVRDPEFMLWQMDASRDHNSDFPFISAVTVWDDSTLAGFIGLINGSFNWDGKVLPCYWMFNFSAREEYRQSGVASRLLHGVLKLPVRVLCAAGIRPDIYYFFRAMKYRMVDTLPRLVRIVDADTSAQLIGCSASTLPFAPFGGNGVTGVTIDVPDFSEATGGSNRWDAYWQAYTSQGFLGTHHDSEFMRWRYAEHPRLDYDVAVARGTGGEAGSYTGHALYRMEGIRDMDHKVMRLIEFGALNDDARAGLLRHVHSVAKEEGALFIDHYNTNPDQALREGDGWFEEREGEKPVIPALFQPLYNGYHKVQATVRFLGEDVPSEEEFRAKIRIVKSDGDQDRIN